MNRHIINNMKEILKDAFGNDNVQFFQFFQKNKRNPTRKHIKETQKYIL